MTTPTAPTPQTPHTPQPPSNTYVLQYDGQTFVLTETDYTRLHKVYDRGLAVSSLLFSFVPVGSGIGDEVEIAIGSGAQFVLTKQGQA